MSCPHLFGGALCPLVLSSRCGPLHGDNDQCPVNFGPWGAWRSALAIFAPVAELFEVWPTLVSLQVASDGDYALEAVGWSP